MSVSCPHCQALLEVDFEPGTEFTCGACQGLVAMPDPGPTAVPPPAPPPSRAPAPAPVQRRPAPSAPVRRAPEAPRPGPGAAPARSLPPAAIIGTAVGAVALFVLLIVVFSGGGTDDGGAGGADRRAPRKTQARPEPRRPVDPYVAARTRAERSDRVEEIMSFAEQAWTRSLQAAEQGDEPARKRYLRDAERAYDHVIRLDDDDAVARARRGWVHFDPARVQELAKLTFLPRSTRSDLEFALEDWRERNRKDRDRARWLRADRGFGKEWAVLERKAERLVALEEERKTDPFYAKARSRGGSVARELSALDDPDFHIGGAKGNAFRIFTRKPYALLVQFEPGRGDEDRLAERWGDVLSDLQKTFYARFQKSTGLRPVTDPVVVVILRSMSEYIKYLRIKDASARVTSAGHYEPWNSRLVVFMQGSEEGERTTLFHEGTHQIIDWGMKSARNYALAQGRQSLWFSEGIADYFGGHGVRFDSSTLSYVYTPGLINLERIATLEKAVKNDTLFPLGELLDYRRLDYIKDQKDVKKSSRVLIAYAQGWALCYFLNNWKDGRYRKDFAAYLKQELQGRSGSTAFDLVFARYGRTTLEKEFKAMLDFLIKAAREKRIANGRLIAPPAGR